MDYNQALAKLEKYGQTQLLRFYDELDEAQKAELLGQIERVDFDSIQVEPVDANKGKIEPMGAMKVAEIEAKKATNPEEALKLVKAYITTFPAEGAAYKPELPELSAKAAEWKKAQKAAK